MLAARNDLCEVFFEMKYYQRMALIKQSEKVQARMKIKRVERYFAIISIVMFLNLKISAMGAFCLSWESL